MGTKKLYNGELTLEEIKALVEQTKTSGKMLVYTVILYKISGEINILRRYINASSSLSYVNASSSLSKDGSCLFYEDTDYTGRFVTLSDSHLFTNYWLAYACALHLKEIEECLTLVS